MRRKQRLRKAEVQEVPTFPAEVPVAKDPPPVEDEAEEVVRRMVEAAYT